MAELKEQLLSALVSEPSVDTFDFKEFDVSGIPTIKLDASQVSIIRQSLSSSKRRAQTNPEISISQTEIIEPLDPRLTNDFESATVKATETNETGIRKSPKVRRNLKEAKRKKEFPSSPTLLQPNTPSPKTKKQKIETTQPIPPSCLPIIEPNGTIIGYMKMENNQPTGYFPQMIGLDGNIIPIQIEKVNQNFTIQLNSNPNEINEQKNEKQQNGICLEKKPIDSLENDNDQEIKKTRRRNRKLKLSTPICDDHVIPSLSLETIDESKNNENLPKSARNNEKKQNDAGGWRQCKADKRAVLLGSKIPKFASMRNPQALEDSPRGVIPSKWSTIRSRNTDVVIRPRKPKLKSAKTFTIPIDQKTRDQLLSRAKTLGIREMDKYQKSIKKLTKKQEKEMEICKEKENQKLQFNRIKYETEMEKNKQHFEKEIRLNEKKLTKKSKQHDIELDELTKNSDKKHDQYIQKSDEKYQEIKRNLRVEYEEKRNQTLNNHKEEFESKKRNPCTFDKKYLKSLKSSQKLENFIAERLCTIELDHLKQFSDAKLKLQQSDLTIDTIQATNDKLFNFQVEILQTRNVSEMNFYNDMIDTNLKLLENLHNEEINSAQIIHEFTLKQLEQVFNEEINEQNMLLDVTWKFKEKELQASEDFNSDALNQLEIESRKLRQKAHKELGEAQETKKNFLEIQFMQELSDLKFKHTEEIFETKLEAAKTRLQMITQYHDKETKLFAEREERHTRSVSESYNVLFRETLDAQDEIIQFLKSQKDILLENISKESKKCMEDYLCTIINNVNHYFTKTISKLKTEFATSNKVLQKRICNAEDAVNRVYRVHTKNLKAKHSLELAEFQHLIEKLEVDNIRESSTQKN